MTSLDARAGRQAESLRRAGLRRPRRLADSRRRRISSTTEFTVGGVTHYWAYLGKAEWDGAKVAAGLTPLIEEHVRFWGRCRYTNYAFLNIVTGGGGGSGVEHLNSVAITDERRSRTTPEARFRNAAFISHEYFHAMNVKRLRPVELGPFDYEHAPVTTGLWVGEGLTSYFGDLLAARVGPRHAGRTI